MSQPILTSPPIQLRPFTLADAPTLARLADNPNIAATLRNRFPSPYTLEDAHQFLSAIEKGDLPPAYAICLSSDGTITGGIDLTPRHDVEHRTGEIGYWVAEEFWGRGYATAALVAFSAWCFRQDANLLRLEALAYESNVGSRRVLEKAGFVPEGRRRNAVEKNGRVMDCFTFGLLREECIGGDGGA